MQVNVDTNTTLTTFSLGETADDAIEMQVDDETVLQLGLRPDEINQFDRLLDETLEDPLDPPATERNPRDGLCPSIPEPVFMPLGDGDIKITVEASIGPEVPVEEIVDNKTVRVDGEKLPPKAPGDLIIC